MTVDEFGSCPGPTAEAPRETASERPPLPSVWLDDLETYRWSRDLIGESGCAVYRLHGKEGMPDLYLKHGQDAFTNDVVDEAIRLRWLQRRLPVPAFLRCDSSADAAWLLTMAMPGQTAYQRLCEPDSDREAIVASLAHFLRRLHEVPTTECPFNSDHHLRMALARRRIEAGLVEEEDFDPARQGWTAEQVWDAMQTCLPFAPDPVVTHGDFSLDNLLMQGDEVVGCIDVGRVGVADRYQDLAILWNCLGEFDPALQLALFDAYGVAAVERRKLDFHLMLDELF